MKNVKLEMPPQKDFLIIFWVNIKCFLFQFKTIFNKNVALLILSFLAIDKS